MKKISRKIYSMCINNQSQRKAMALLIFVKSKLPSSTLTNFSYNRLKQVAGLHITTLKKRMKTLSEMGLIQKVGKNNEHILFCSVRDKNSNVILDRIVYDSVKSVEEGLLSMFIVEVQRKKEYVRQLTEKLANPKSNEEFKKVRRICRKRGYAKFNESGISYNYIARKLGIQLNKVSSIIKYAIKNKILHKYTRIRLIEKVPYYAKEALSFWDDAVNVFATKDNIYEVKANVYSIPSEWEAGMVIIRL